MHIRYYDSTHILTSNSKFSYFLRNRIFYVIVFLYAYPVLLSCHYGSTSNCTMRLRNRRAGNGDLPSFYIVSCLRKLNIYSIWLWRYSYQTFHPQEDTILREELDRYSQLFYLTLTYRTSDTTIAQIVVNTKPTKAKFVSTFVLSIICTAHFFFAFFVRILSTIVFSFLRSLSEM